MEVGSSHGAYNCEQRDLELLLEAFGNAFSLNDIASAYNQAKHNVDMAGELLFTWGYTSSADTYASAKEELDVVTESSLSSEKEDTSSTSSAFSSDTAIQKSHTEIESLRISKGKKCTASMGTVSCVIGKEYVNSTPQTYESSEATKPLKIDAKELPISEILIEEDPQSVTAGDDAMHKDVEAFIFQMLGDGFELEQNVIKEVLGLCGYDIEKGVEKLLNLSATTLGVIDDGLAAVEPTGKFREQEFFKSQGRARNLGFNKRYVDGNKLRTQQDILESLFTAPERLEDKPRRRSPVRAVKNRKIFGKPVVEPYRDAETTMKHRTSTVPLPNDDDDADPDEDDENSYEVLRTAVKEHFITMKEYYKSAVEAFSKGDHDRANKLSEKGHFFKNRAREADDKSAQKIFNTRDEDWHLDMRDHEPREAVRLLRTHLISIPGIASYHYLKVIVGTSDDDPKRAIKRRITKVLEKESIKWTEEEDGSTMSIRLEDINPKKLSFSEK